MFDQAALQCLKLNIPLYKDIEINSDWVSNAAEDDSELREALSAEHCPPPPSPIVAITSSQSMNGEYLYMYVYYVCVICKYLLATPTNTISCKMKMSHVLILRVC